MGFYISGFYREGRKEGSWFKRVSEVKESKTKSPYSHLTKEIQGVFTPAITKICHVDGNVNRKISKKLPLDVHYVSSTSIEKSLILPDPEGKAPVTAPAG